MARSDDDRQHRFWVHVAALLEHPGVSRSTMMGLPCVRLHGAFFASFDHRTGDLLVKLPEARVEALIASGTAHPFAPAGRRFRAWAAVPSGDEAAWRSLIEEAFAHVATLPAKPPKHRRAP